MEFKTWRRKSLKKHYSAKAFPPDKIILIAAKSFARTTVEIYTVDNFNCSLIFNLPVLIVKFLPGKFSHEIYNHATFQQFYLYLWILVQHFLKILDERQVYRRKQAEKIVKKNKNLYKIVIVVVTKLLL